MMTVSAGFVTVTCVTSSSGVVSSPSSSIAFSATDLQPAMSRYDCTFDLARLSPSVDMPTSSVCVETTYPLAPAV